MYVCEMFRVGWDVGCAEKAGCTVIFVCGRRSCYVFVSNVFDGEDSEKMRI